MENQTSLDENLLSQHSAPPLAPSPEVPAAVSKPIITLAIILLCVYLIVGVLTYSLFREQFSGDSTNLFVDALYFSIVTMCTVGYGDIVPLTITTKILTIVLVSIGVLFLDFLLNRVVNHVLDLQEKAILARIKTPSSRNRAVRDHIVDVVNGRIRIKWKLRLAFCVVFFCIGVGTLFLCLYEQLDFVDSVYLSVISVTTVGYGDKTFKTLVGRVFAVFWLLFSSIAMASLFFYFAEKRIDGAIMKLPTTTTTSMR